MKTGYIIVLKRACRVYGREQAAGAVIECDATHADDLFIASRAAHAIQYRLANNGVNECAVIVADGKHTEPAKVRWVDADGDGAVKLRKQLDAAAAAIVKAEAERQKIRDDRKAKSADDDVAALKAKLRTLGSDADADAAAAVKSVKDSIAKLRKKIDDEYAKGDKADEGKVAKWESEIDELLK